MKKLRIIIQFFIVVFLSSCNDSWLDVKRDLSLTVPSTLKDLRSILNYTLLHNDYVGLAELSADEYEMNDAVYNGLSAMERNLYIWNAEIYEDRPTLSEWNLTYQQIFYCNVVLESINKVNLSIGEKQNWNHIKGEALFYRAKAFYNLTQLFAKQYDPNTASQDLGIHLRLSADLNIPTTRANLEECYQQVVDDLKIAASLMGVTPFAQTQASRPSAYAALARCFLAMRQYENAGLYADSCLQLRNELMDFNEIDLTKVYPIPIFNKEIIQHSILSPLYTGFDRPEGYIPVNLYSKYKEYDLRKELFFMDVGEGKMCFRGSYSGSFQLFHGCTVGEMFLIRAESAARNNNIDAALYDLNSLRRNRFHKDFFVPLISDNSEQVLKFVLNERQLELIRRGLRWTDLKRLNKESQFEETLYRTVEGKQYTLSPNDSKYVLPIPDYIIKSSGIEQNLRK